MKKERNYATVTQILDEKSFVRNFEAPSEIFQRNVVRRARHVDIAIRVVRWLSITCVCSLLLLLIFLLSGCTAHRTLTYNYTFKADSVQYEAIFVTTEAYDTERSKK